MKPALPYCIRHIACFRQWYADNRRITPEVMRLSRRRDTGTVHAWRKAEEWDRVADEMDAATAATIVNGIMTREEELQAAKDTHQRETIEQVAELRAVLKAMIVNLRARQTVGADVDVSEVREATAAATNLAKAAQALGFNWENPTKIDATIETLPPDEAADLRAHLLPQLLKDKADKPAAEA